MFLPLTLSLEGVRPPLGNHGNSENLKIEDWWNEVIMSKDNVFSRKDIVLAAANQDGGAHVDNNPSIKTRELKAGIGTFTTFTNSVEVTEDLIDHHYPLLRQLGYEVLHSSELISLANIPSA